MEVTYSVQDIAYDAHFHHAYELIYVLRGRMRIAFGAKAYEAGPHSLVCINHLEEHALEVLEAPYERYYILLPPRETDALVQDVALLSLLKNRPTSFVHVLDVEAISTDMRYLFATLEKTCASPATAYAQPHTACLLRLLLMAVFRHLPEAFPIAPGDSGAPEFALQQAIDARFQEPLSIEDLSAQCFLSASRLTHRFKARTGYSPKQYLTLTRLAHARALLSEGNVTVTQAALQSGFSDVSNFIHRFKAEYGVTPRKVR